MRATDDQPSRDRRVALIGMRGSGKTTVGRLLADRIAAAFVDTDQAVVAAAGRSISEIFDDEGEAGFRALERAIVADLIFRSPTVVSVGGGAVLDAGIVEWLRHHATVVWLTAPPDVLWSRIKADPSTAAWRPRLTGLVGVAEVERLLAERRQLYRRAAHAAISTDGCTPAQVVDRITAVLP